MTSPLPCEQFHSQFVIDEGNEVLVDSLDWFTLRLDVDDDELSLWAWPATGEPTGWSQGDWNADGVFESSDFVSALQGGGYEIGARAAVAAVPEPSAAILLALGLLGMARLRKR